jgi:hypothetical protein
MESERILHGWVGQCDTPVWNVLVDLLGTDLAGRFMWMGEIELEDGGRLHAYKDWESRRYLHLADDGRAFQYTAGNSYREVALRRAILDVYGECIGCSLTGVEQAALRLALSKARSDPPAL